MEDFNAKMRKKNDKYTAADYHEIRMKNWRGDQIVGFTERNRLRNTNIPKTNT